MGKIFCFMGKSACGKDSIYKQILSDETIPVKTLVPYTTRPIRDGEKNGVEYYFVSEEKQLTLERQGKIIELRAYHTVHGLWKYFTVNDHQLNLASNDYLIIGTLESYLRLQEYFGASSLVPLYIELETGERLQRALNRERLQTEPKYLELCRRFLADEEDFSSENLERAGIVQKFINNDLAQCANEIRSYIRKHL
ncbi:MAG: guanylate kinase [Lachnospiraceae bacterium]|nr:guanylate kinase [Lachnospiraceae bacterium]